MASQRCLTVLCALACLAGTANAEEEAGSEAAEGVSIALAATTIGSMCFLMCLHYLTNHPDRDMRRYTYQIISTTISIFCAVLIFNAINQIVEQFMDDVSLESKVVVSLMHMLMWYIMLQIAVGITVTQTMETLFTGDSSDESALLDKELKSQKIELNTTAIATLLAHMTGFASIHVFATIQQGEFFRQSVLMSLAVPPMAATSHSVLQILSNKVRNRLHSIQAGEHIDENEREEGKLWHEQTGEAENDIMALTVSFTFMQSVRFCIGGALPNSEGGESWAATTGHSDQSVGFLVLAALASAVVTLALQMYIFEDEEKEHGDHAEHGHHEEKEEEEEYDFDSLLPHRLAMDIRKHPDKYIEKLVDYAMMVFAWGVAFGARWFLGSRFADSTEDLMLLSVSVAMLVSFLSFGFIWVLDKLADAEFTDDRTDSGIIKVISGLGVAVGFSWEQCYDQAAEALSEGVSNPSATRLLIAVFCAFAVVPAWRWFVLPMEIQGGWQWGFIVDAADATHHEKWVELLNDKSFHALYKKSKRVRKVLREIVHADPEFERGTSPDDGPSSHHRKLKGKTAETHAVHDVVARWQNKMKAKSQTNLGGEGGGSAPATPAAGLAALAKLSAAGAKGAQDGYMQLPGGPAGGTKAAGSAPSAQEQQRVEELLEENTRLKAALQEQAARFNSHMLAVDHSMGIIQGKVSAAASKDVSPRRSYAVLPGRPV